jgi:hypothetical protein
MKGICHILVKSTFIATLLNLISVTTSVV